MEDQIVYIFHILYTILSCLAMPLFWVETLLFWMLGLPTSTSFRMFRRADTVPDYYATVAYSYALVTIMLIPYFIYFDRRDGRGPLGRLLHPLTREASPFTEYSIMFARVWLAVAWVNLAVAQFMTDYNLVSVCAKISCVLFIL
ncbi:uncharacterized protein B0H64DRAFT_175637 [Chaetomium fimeti]|uniref:Uncharacterized protein n=1 Tax=Chaetomium fimeti TaxID=1854472 RepID=A0AAE0HCV2_9PEZI|nr:hypothetical protein B0H64DRAFT_175637 [Chaetomium fimeti]